MPMKDDHAAKPAAARGRASDAKPLGDDSQPATDHARRCRWPAAAAIGLLVVLLNLLVWRAINPPLPAADVLPRVAGLAYNAFQRWDSPLARAYPGDAAIEADMQLLARSTSRLRTYSAAEFAALPALAQRHGLKLAQGVWLDGRRDANERELLAATAAVRNHPNIERVIAGNETQLHHTLPAADLYAHLDRLRAAVRVPVSTAEPWHIWLSQPELARHVDFITVHLLPYWEGVALESAVDDSLRRYQMVRERFPGKPVVIGEIGWPSGGDDVAQARPTPATQAAFVREFLARSASMELDYYLMEAIDQPWKTATEGSVGAHWGLLDAARQAKFSFSGPVFADPFWHGKAALSSLLALVALLPFLLHFAHMRLPGRLCFAMSVQAVASFAVLLGAMPLDRYLHVQDLVLLVLLVPALVLMSAILLAQAFEFAELFWSGSLRRLSLAQPMQPGQPAPFVSIHLACCNEPPEMVIAAIDSLRALDWPTFEVVIVDNNTADPARWRPVQAHVQALGATADGRQVELRFFHLPCWPGFKAGALNFALQQTDPRAGWIAVVDADYLVQPSWLRALGGAFADPTVGAVQAPQAHRDWSAQRLRRMMNWEYDGFFRIGMHHRHERDAIVQHGTMAVIRASALRQAGGWREDNICEDTELGLRLLQRGHRVTYADQVLGTGLVPSDFASYQRQRRRWAQGAMQILRAHAAALFGRSPLTLGQRYHFVAGWLPWIGDALHLVFSIGAMIWTIGLITAPQWFRLPIALFVVPLAVFFMARLLLVPLLYWKRVRCSIGDSAGAALAGIGLSHSIARGVFAGLSGRRAVFEVTRKGATDTASSARPLSAPGRFAGVREEAALLSGLLCCIAAVTLRPPAVGAALAGWFVVLAMHALPYAAALICALLSSNRHVGRQATAMPAPRRDMRAQHAEAATFRE